MMMANKRGADAEASTPLGWSGGMVTAIMIRNTKSVY